MNGNFETAVWLIVVLPLEYVSVRLQPRTVEGAIVTVCREVPRHVVVLTSPAATSPQSAPRVTLPIPPGSASARARLNWHRRSFRMWQPSTTQPSFGSRVSRTSSHRRPDFRA